MSTETQRNVLSIMVMVLLIVCSLQAFALRSAAAQVEIWKNELAAGVGGVSRDTSITAQANKPKNHSSFTYGAGTSSSAMGNSSNTKCILMDKLTNVNNC